MSIALNSDSNTFYTGAILDVLKVDFIFLCHLVHKILGWVLYRKYRYRYILKCFLWPGSPIVRFSLCFSWRWCFEWLGNVYMLPTGSDL